MESEWMINPAETPLDGHTPDLTITQPTIHVSFLEKSRCRLSNFQDFGFVKLSIEGLA